jgi:hypothetical protein
MEVLCDACAGMKKNTYLPLVKETIDLEDPELEQRLSERFNACKTMNELTYHFICVFGDELGGGLSTAEIYNFVRYFKKDWTIKGPRGGTSLRKTIYTVCTNGVKKKKLVKIMKNKRAFYDIANTKESEV